MSNHLEKLSFLASSNGSFIEELYGRYLTDPSSVDPEWARFFVDLADEAPDVLKELEGASWAPRTTKVIGNGEVEPATATEGAGPETVAPEVRSATLDSI